MSSLPPEVQSLLCSTESESELPVIEERDIWLKMCSGRAVKSGAPCDLPAKLHAEFAPEIARPAAIIFNKIIQTGVWPSKWKVEHGVPLKKSNSSNDVQDEDSVRIISLTPYLSKIFEKFVMDWLLKFIGEKIDKKQFGGAKGTSTSHYLVEFINFILHNLDLGNHAVLATIMGAPKWLIDIVMVF